MHLILRYLSRYKAQCILSPLFKLLEACFELIVPIAVAYLIDNCFTSSDNSLTSKIIGLLLVFAVVGYVIALFAQFFAADCASKVSSDIRSDLYKHVSFLSEAQVEEISASTITTALTGDINQIQTGINLTLRLLLRSPLIVIGATIMAFTVDSRLALIFVVITAILAIILFVVMRSAIPLFEKARKALDSIVERTSSYLSGVKVIRSYNRTADESSSFSEKSDFYSKQSNKAANMSSLINPLTFVTVNLGICALIYFGHIRFDFGLLTAGAIVALYNYMSQILIELIKLANLIVSVSRSIACANRVSSIISISSDNNGEFNLEGESHLPRSVEFSNVTFTYQGNKKPTIEGLSFKVNAGESIGIIGVTGSGKSTLGYLIDGLYFASEGNVKISDVDITNISSSSLHSCVSLCLQKTKLITDSIKNNVLFFREEKTDKTLQEALEISCCKEFINSKQEGVDTIVHTSGSGLSGGQRQRIGIARSILYKPGVLILDDSLSALDSVTEAKVLEGISNQENKPTLFIISQKIKSVAKCDKILILEDGKLSGFDTHENLLKSNKAYIELNTLQSSGGELS